MNREPSTPAERIRWAVKQSGHRLVDVAAYVGCSHATLSQWQNGVTDVHNIKVGLLVRFCEYTGASMSWILSGDGPALTTYGKPAAEPPLVALAARIARDLPPGVTDMATRLLQALEPPPGGTDTPSSGDGGTAAAA